jgi:hypothetical protein
MMSQSRKPTLWNEVRAVFRTPALLMWCALMTFVPFYIFESGLPQPGDFLIVIVLPLTLMGWDRRLERSVVRPLRILLWFTLWVALVNYAWAIILDRWALHGKETFVLFPVYYTYNAVIFFVVLVLHHRFGTRFLRCTVGAVILAVSVQVLYSFVSPPQNVLRDAVFFNRPNQLGYYALLAASVLGICQPRLKINILIVSLVMSGCVYLALLSASRAAAGGVAIIFIVTFVTNPKLILTTVPVILIAMAIGGPVTRAFEATEKRIRVDQFPQYSFFEERGYGRIRDNLEYTVLGAGEGGTDRFRDPVVGTHEIHSSIGTIIFSYGIIGVLLFSTFLIRIFRGAEIRIALILIPPLAYTSAHNGMRESMFWIMFALFAILKAKPVLPRASAGPLQPVVA